MRKSLYLLSGAMLCLLASCVEKEPDGGLINETPNVGDVSDFSTEKTVTLNIDYGYSGYSAGFNVYI